MADDENTTPPPQPEPPQAPMPMAETVPMAAAADSAAQAEYEAEMERYRQELAAWEAQYGTQARAAATTGAAADASTGDGASGPDVETGAQAAVQEAAGGGADVDTQDTSAPDTAAPAKKKHTGCIIAVVVALFLLLMCGVLGALGAFFWLGGGGLTGTSTNPDSLGMAGTGTPRATVESWVAATSKGDRKAVEALGSSEYVASLDEDQFTNPQDFAYTITDVKDEGQFAVVTATRTSPEIPGTMTLGFELKKQSSGDWLIQSVQITGEDIDGGSSSGSSTSSAGASTSATADQADGTGTYVIDEKQADETVTSLLEAVNNGDPLTLNSVTTTTFHKANPKWFDGSLAKTLKGVKIVKTIRKGDVWLVVTSEDWGKGPETAVYTVVTRGAEGRVDDRSGAV